MCSPAKRNDWVEIENVNRNVKMADSELLRYA
jgi:hypothetical protein